MEDLKAGAERVVGLAKSKKLTLLTVESCTAGALACALAEAEGAGQVLDVLSSTLREQILCCRRADVYVHRSKRAGGQGDGGWRP